MQGVFLWNVGCQVQIFAVLAFLLEDHFQLFMISVKGARFSISELTGMEISPRPLAHASVKTPWVSTNCKFFATYTGKQSLFPLIFLSFCSWYVNVWCGSVWHVNEGKQHEEGRKQRLSLFHTTNSFQPEWVSSLWCVKTFMTARPIQRIWNGMLPESGGMFSGSFYFSAKHCNAVWLNHPLLALPKYLQMYKCNSICSGTHVSHHNHPSFTANFLFERKSLSATVSGLFNKQGISCKRYIKFI